MKNRSKVEEKLSGKFAIDFSAVSLALILLMAGFLLWIIIVNGISVFWPKHLNLITLNNERLILGIHQKEDKKTKQSLYKIGNYDLYGLSYKWIKEEDITKITSAIDAFIIERAEYGVFFGYFDAPQDQQKNQYAQFIEEKKKVDLLLEKKEALIEKINQFNLTVRELEKEQRLILYKKGNEADPELQKLKKEQHSTQEQYETTLSNLRQLEKEIAEFKIKIISADGKKINFEIAQALHLYYPNRLSFLDKIGYYLSGLWAFLSENPREANTEGGIFPAIFGTVSLVIIMSIFVFPIGVLTAIYLNEYAHDGWLIRLIRISINNLAGVPSIVFGIFGLGFFVYGLGTEIDQLFYAESLPTPTFGTGGILWASLTMALLTAPVVIVTTEEALSSLPGGVREASLALGATKWQTLSRIVLPMSLPGMMTGFILAMARAAGEVAPLMITGVVKLAPALPIDTTFPFVHLERKFMHLGFHIYDLGFQSPDAEAARPIVFVTSLILIMIVLLLSTGAILLREKMKRKFMMQTF